MAERTRVAGIAALAALVVTATACSSSAPAPAQQPNSTSPSSTSSTSPSSTAHAAAIPAAGFRAAGSQLLTRTIRGGDSRFAARPAEIYLPPAARTHPHDRFPLLLLLHGTSGGPSDWVDKGGAGAILDRFAAAHGGQAPVVVMPDINGALHADTECVRSTSGGNVERYLLDVVPAWIIAHLPVTTGARTWGIAGLSEGGTCALVLGLRASPRWTFVGDYSGLKRPTVTDTDNRAATIAQLFGGSAAAYDAHDPTLLLRRHRYPAVSFWFECGASDRTVVADQAVVAALARRSGRAVHASTTPGRHDWTVFSRAFAASLPWFWAGTA